MSRILARGVFRKFRTERLKYIALFFVISIAVFLVVSIVAVAETLIGGATKYAEDGKVEDGQFVLFAPLSASERQRLEEKGISIEDTSYFDSLRSDGSTLRIFPVRTKVNLPIVEEGRIPVLHHADSSEIARSSGLSVHEIFVEKIYAGIKGIRLGDLLSVEGVDYTVVGIGAVPDYDTPLKNLTDFSSNSRAFGIALVNREQGVDIPVNGAVAEYRYSYRLNGAMSDDDLKKELSSEFPLMMFLTREDNPRIGGLVEDTQIDRNIGLFAGVIAMMLLTYIISVFVVHEIDSESGVIGTLYALGTSRGCILRNYLILPVLLTLFGGAVGTFIGMSPVGIEFQSASKYSYFSIVKVPTVYPLYLMIYGVLMPPAVACIVNFLVIRRKLSRSALSLIRNERDGGSARGSFRKFLQDTFYAGATKHLSGITYTRAFRVRQMMKELTASVRMLVGLFLSLLILFLGIDCYLLCAHVSEQNKIDTKFGYMYLYRLPSADPPEGGEIALYKTLSKEIYGKSFPVTLLGIDGNSRYFDVRFGDRSDNRKGDAEREVAVSTAMAIKFGIQVGDRIALEDNHEEVLHTFEVTDIVQYSVGFYVFMEIDAMRERFDFVDGNGVSGEKVHNAVFSDEELDEIPKERLLSTVSREDIADASDTFLELLMPLIVSMVIVSVLVFVIVMLLLTNVMIERSSYDISMFKVLGYRNGELRKLYLDGNFYMVAIGLLFLLPLAKRLMDAAYPVLVANIATEMRMDFSAASYAVLYVAIILLYLILHTVLSLKFRRIGVAQILKPVNR